ncbi:MAG: nucleotidyltransferase family protein [Firmicutes bacterium]|nr:nucleotidyltransferase family protein [Bacillota bacterium]
MLLLLARTELNAGQQEQLRSWLAQVDWDGLILLAERHGLLPLLNEHLARCAPDLLPPYWQPFVARYVEATAVSGLELTAELVRVVAALAEQSITVVPYKGPVAAALLYGNLALRVFGDLDLLVRERESVAAGAVLERLGYHATFGSDLTQPRRHGAPGQYAFRHPERRHLVELHTEATLRYFPVRVDFDEFWSRLQPAPIGAARFETLAPEDLLLFLCVHGAKDFWERLAWIADVAQLVRRHPGLDWEAALARAERYGAGRIVRLGLALAQQLLEAPLPAAVAAHVRADAAAGSLVQQITRELFAETSSFEQLVRRFWFRVRLHGRLGGGLRYAARLLFQPTEVDWEAVRLPRPLYALYYLLRPARLVWRYGTGVMGRARVPDLGNFEPTPEEVVLRMLELAEVKPADVVFDLGCGDGRCVVLAARQFGARGVGVDVDPERVAEARARARREGVADRVRILQQDARSVSLREATVVLLTLTGTAHLKLREKLRRELPAGARIVARRNHLGGWAPAHAEEFVDHQGTVNVLYLWRL